MLKILKVKYLAKHYLVDKHNDFIMFSKFLSMYWRLRNIKYRNPLDNRHKNKLRFVFTFSSQYKFKDWYETKSLKVFRSFLCLNVGADIMIN